MINAGKFLELVEKINVGQSNYQAVVLSALIPVYHMEMDLENIAATLFIKNTGIRRPGFVNSEAFYASKACPVWKVLTGKKMIVKTAHGYKINSNLTKACKDDAMKTLRRKLKEAGTS